MRHQFVFVAWVAIKRPIRHGRRDLRYIPQFHHLVQTWALNRQLPARLYDSHPLAHSIFGVPRIEVFDYMDRAGFVRVVVGERQSAQISRYIRLNLHPLLMLQLVQRFALKRPEIDANPALLFLIASP